ncbi:transposon-encoded TnpW family protein [Enterocloster clostridioformis]|uniref:transposon-encoded TnpW family protein n=2 Tax=Lachnospiraceae TaxID=186803 RepID=UPI001FAD4D6D|nr:transposon-encoded TnpW family protein [Enterocloster clostridioformis]MDB2130866.1 transposon-encoded TnpW family protein [Enterocloster clostridioformis]MDU1961102.1 transposon-encoded TnpW family protein [Enterocloster clostridioformis]
MTSQKGASAPQGDSTAPNRVACQELLRGNGFPYQKFLFLSFNDMRKDTMTKNNDNQNCQYMTRRIGSTTYKVKVVFSDNGGETMEEKILRMIRNEGLQNGEERGMMDAPQMSRQSERSAS